jgi:hypothetical protein
VNDPKRLLDGGGPEELRSLIAAAEKDVLDDAATERVRSAVIAAVPGGTATAAVQRTSWQAWTALASKPISLVLLAGLAGVGVYALTSAPPSPGAGTPRTTNPSAPLSEHSSDLPGAKLLEDVPHPVSPPPEAPAPAKPIAAQPAVPAPRANAAPPSAPASQRSSAAAVASSIPEPPSPREGLLLLQARQALESDPARALSLIRQHEREFPNSQLGPERAKLLEDAQKRLGE